MERRAAPLPAAMNASVSILDMRPIVRLCSNVLR
jgi:hypothetical protein